jgi:transposase
MAASTGLVHYIGVDIGKEHLQVGAHPQRDRLANTLGAISTWLVSIQERLGAVHLIAEATASGYQRALIAAAAAHQVALTLANPRQVRDFARSLGRLEKTDPIDSQVLGRFGEATRPAPTAPPSPAHQALREWIEQRAHEQARLLAEQNRLEHLADPTLRAWVQRECSRLRSCIERIDQQLQRLLETDAPLLERAQTLCLVEGVGQLTALIVLAYMPELGRLNARQAAKLAGLAPLPDDSGTRHGPRHIAHGRAPLRRALYCAALVAARHNPILKDLYTRLRQRGKPAKLALVALARKLLIFLNSLLKPAPLPQT